MTGLTAAELAHRAGTTPEWPTARVGVHACPLVFRFGGTVNLASRSTDFARPGEVLVSAAVAGTVGEDAGIALEPIGDIGLRGLAEPVPLFRAAIRDSSPGE